MWDSQTKRDKLPRKRVTRRKKGKDSKKDEQTGLIRDIREGGEGKTKGKKRRALKKERGEREKKKEKNAKKERNVKAKKGMGKKGRGK